MKIFKTPLAIEYPFGNVNLWYKLIPRFIAESTSITNAISLLLGNLKVTYNSIEHNIKYGKYIDNILLINSYSIVNVLSVP